MPHRITFDRTSEFTNCSLSTYFYIIPIQTDRDAKDGNSSWRHLIAAYYAMFIGWLESCDCCTEILDRFIELFLSLEERESSPQLVHI